MSLINFLASHRQEFVHLLAQHILLVGVSTLVAIAIGIPVGILAARRPRVGAPVVWVANVVQTIPSLAMFGFLLPLPFVGGLGARVAIFVLVLYALLPIIRTTVSGIGSVDRVVVEAATALGLTPRQILWRVQLPLALPSIVAGVRVASVIGVGTATIAAAVGAGGLGEYIFRGLSMVEPTVILAGAVPAACLALLVDGGLLLAERSLSRRRRRRSLVPAVAAGVALVVLATAVGAATRDRQGAIRVGSKNFTEQIILGEILAQTIENRRGLPGRAPVEPGWYLHLRPGAALRRHRRLRRVHRHRRHRCLQESRRDGSRPRLRARSPALRRGGVDAAEAAGLREHVRDPRPRRRCAPVGVAHHRRRVEVHADLAGRLRIRVPAASRWISRPGRPIRAPLRRPPRAMDLSLIYRALASRQVDLIAGDATSGLISAYDLAMLRDDRHYFPPYDAAPVVRREVLLRYPDVRVALDGLAGRITIDDMRRLNYAVDAGRQDPVAVVREFLAQLERSSPPKG